MTVPEAAEEVLDLQKQSYKIEAEIIDFHNLPPLKDTIKTLQGCGDTFYGEFLNQALRGAVAIRITDGVLNIHRLMVHPTYFRQGIAVELVRFIENLEATFHTMIVSTGSKNTPAVQFYKKCGFKETKLTKIEEKLFLTTFKKQIKPAKGGGA